MFLSCVLVYQTKSQSPVLIEGNKIFISEKRECFAKKNLSAPRAGEKPGVVSLRQLQTIPLDIRIR